VVSVGSSGQAGQLDVLWSPRLARAGGYSCGLTVEHLKDCRNCVASSVFVDLRRQACTPELGPLETELFERFSLRVSVRSQSEGLGLLQWLRRRQPDECRIEPLRLDEIGR